MQCSGRNLRNAIRTRGTQKHRTDSEIIIRRRRSTESNWTLREEDTDSACFQIHSAASGSTKKAPMTILLAIQQNRRQVRLVNKVLTSHQTGIGLLTFPAQTREFTANITSTTKLHTIIASVATFRGEQERQ